MNKLDLKIDDAVLKKTIRCKNDFRCLAGNKECICGVVGSIGSSMVEIKSEWHKSCQYCLPFGSSAFCLCPTRIELYNCYKM